MEFVPFPFSREPQPAGRYYRGKVRYFYRGVEVGDAVGPSTRNFARAAGWARKRLARDGDVVDDIYTLLVTFWAHLLPRVSRSL